EPVDSNGGTGNVIPDDTAGTGQTDDGGTGPVIPDDTAGTGQTDDGGTGNVIPDDTAGTGPTDTGGTGPTDTGGTGPTDTGGTGPTDTGGTGTGGTDPVDDCSRTSDPATGDPIVDAALELQTKTSEVICRQWLLNPDRKNALGLLSSYYNQGLPGDPSQSVPVDSNVGSSLSRCYIYDFGVLLEDYIVPNFDDLNSQEIDEILTQVEILLTLQNIDNTWDSAYGNSGGVEMPMLGPLAKLGQGLLLLSEKIEDAGLVIQIQNAVQNLVNAIMGNAVSPSAWTLSVPHQTTTYTVYRQTPYSDDFANPEENSRFAQLLLSLYDLNTASNMVYLRAAEDIFSAWARYTGADAATFAFDPNGLPVWSLANWEGAEGQVEFRKLAHRLYYNYSDAIQPETQSLLDALFTAEWVLSNDTWTNATWGVDNVTYNWSVNPGETTTTISHALLKQFHADGLEHNELMPVWTELTGNNASALLDSSEFAVEEGYPDIADTLYAEAGNSVLTLNNLCSPEFGLPAIIGPEGFGQTAQWPYPGTPYIYMPLAHHVDNAYAWNAANSLIRLRYSGFIDSLQPSSSQAELLSSAA
ncbi:MAG: hypothetical protein JW774_00470, partial [Candidatus Aureabacteria bacterium]|nr:hypothetical protein [Candidatus Auribacterota bacterium]